MFGTTYRYTLNPDAGTIKLAPTKGQWIATLAVIIVPWAVLALMGYVADQDAAKIDPPTPVPTRKP